LSSAPQRTGVPIFIDRAVTFSARHIRDSNRVEQRSLAVIDMAHDRNHGRADPGFRDRLHPGGGRINFFRRLLFECDHICIRAEEAGHFAGQFRVERLVNRGEYTLGQKARDQILSANLQLFS